jgi:TIR domain
MLSYGHVFISYARQDLAQAHRVYHDLEASGFPAWIDEIRAGSVFTGELEKGIANAALATWKSPDKFAPGTRGTMVGQPAMSESIGAGESAW